MKINSAIELEARAIVDSIKRTIPLDPEKRLTHIDALTDSAVFEILVVVLAAKSRA